MLDVDVEERSRTRGGTGGTGGTFSWTDTDGGRILPSRLRTMALYSDMGRSSENDEASSLFDWTFLRRKARSSFLNARFRCSRIRSASAFAKSSSREVRSRGLLDFVLRARSCSS